MAFTYCQSSGLLFDLNGEKVCAGYSGHGADVNDATKQNISQMGPLPRGMYTIGEAITHPRLGQLAMPLTPDTTNAMYDRSAFYIHGDNAQLNHSGSEGCIVLPHDARVRLAMSGDRRLNVCY